MKWLIWLVGLWLALLMAVVVLAVVKGGPTSPNPVHGYPANVVATDWAMTQQMATSVGPGMDAQMQSYSMLQRSQDPNYLAALEAYGYQIDKMLGRSP